MTSGPEIGVDSTTPDSPVVGRPHETIPPPERSTPTPDIREFEARAAKVEQTLYELTQSQRYRAEEIADEVRASAARWRLSLLSTVWILLIVAAISLWASYSTYNSQRGDGSKFEELAVSLRHDVEKVGAENQELLSLLTEIRARVDGHSRDLTSIEESLRALRTEVEGLETAGGSALERRIAALEARVRELQGRDEHDE